MENRSPRFDPLIVPLAVLATVLGLIIIWDAGYSKAEFIAGPMPREFLLQSGFAIIAFIGASFVSKIKQPQWRTISKVLMVLAIILLLLVEVPQLSKTVNGATRWIKIGPLTIQPAEIAKLACILVLAHALLIKKRLEEAKAKDFAGRLDQWLSVHGHQLAAAACIVFTFIMMEHESDLGTAFVLACSLFAMLVVGKASRKIIIACVAIGSIGVCGLVFKEGYRQDRVFNHVHRWDKGIVETVGFQTTQSEIAATRGGLFGVGFGKGYVKRSIPVATSDFVFATVAEELGLVGTTICLLIIAAISLKLILLGVHYPSTLAGVVSVGVGTWIGIQATINVMMVNGTIPPIGIPLPFYSSGGTSLISIWCAIGLCQSLCKVPKPVIIEEREGNRIGRGHGWARLSGS